MARTTGRKGLLLALAALLLVAVVFDLLSRDSVLRSLVGHDDRGGVERTIRGLRDDLPRSRPRR